MKLIFSILILALSATRLGAKEENEAGVSPLAKFSAEWNNPKYKVCNTAEHTGYLSAKEKEIIYILNLARMYPKLFCKTVLLNVSKASSFIDTSSAYFYKSLVTQMSQMEPLQLLKPDSLCYISAQCHAVTSGKKGYVGHVRQNPECRKKEHLWGECCQYGVSDPLEIIICLLVDENVASLGHRAICLGVYTKMSPSYEPHKLYGSVAVLDFW